MEAASEFGREVETSVIADTDSHEMEDVFTNADKDFMMSEFSAPLIAFFLYEQLEEPSIESPRNVLEEILNRINFIKERFADDQEVLEHIREVEQEVLSKTVSYIGNRFNFEPEDYDISPSSLSFAEKATELYEFFIMNRKEIIVKALTAYVSENSLSIISGYKKRYTRSNQTFKELKAKFGQDLAYLYMLIPDFIDEQIKELPASIDLIEILRLIDDFGYSEGLAVEAIAESDDTQAVVDALLNYGDVSPTDIACIVRSILFDPKRLNQLTNNDDSTTKE